MAGLSLGIAACGSSDNGGSGVRLRRHFARGSRRGEARPELVVGGTQLLDRVLEHARRVGMPGEEFYPVETTVVVRPDPSKG